MFTRALAGLLATLWPWPLVMVFFYATAEGYLNFGGGEKDIVLVLPLALLALIYSVCCLVMWWRGRPLAQCIRRSLAIAFATVLVLWLALVAWQFVGTDVLGVG
jgi:hypothetical protein